ncbi:MAG TPA: hypothetical protein VMB24_03205 [Dehalococcoidales bacterium]|nr:hypothetical protein [Dehalococcoidales bacterium]
MAEDKRLETLQEEIKLMKGELKQSLASVRDYLLNMELPSSEISNILTELGNDDEGVNMKGTLEAPKETLKDDVPAEEPKALQDEEEADTDDLLDLEQPPEETEETTEETPKDMTETEEEIPEEEMQEMPAMEEEEEEIPSAVEELEPEDEIPEELPQDELQPEMSGEEEEEEQEPLTQEEPLMETGNTDELNLSVPKVNMLANLINWVARANKEIGKDNIETFLEVYGISGHLSQELKEVIMRLSDIAEQATDITSSTEIWSQAMLLLHGILTGGDAPLHPATSTWNSDEKITEEEIIEVDKPKDNSVKLKLVLPDEDGENKEFCINLTPEADGGNGKVK